MIEHRLLDLGGPVRMRPLGVGQAVDVGAIGLEVAADLVELLPSPSPGRPC
jgi:hypothetical protein